MIMKWYFWLKTTILQVLIGLTAVLCEFCHIRHILANVDLAFGEDRKQGEQERATDTFVQGHKNLQPMHHL